MAEGSLCAQRSSCCNMVSGLQLLAIRTSCYVIVSCNMDLFIHCCLLPLELHPKPSPTYEICIIITIIIIRFILYGPVAKGGI